MSDFFFNVPATPEICTLSLHDALPISYRNNYTASNDTLFLLPAPSAYCRQQSTLSEIVCQTDTENFLRSEEHTSELQSRQYLVCRLMLENKNLCSQPSNNHLYIILSNC